MPSYTFVSTRQCVRAARRGAGVRRYSARTRSTSTRTRSRRRSRRAPVRSCRCTTPASAAQMDAIMAHRGAASPAGDRGCRAGDLARPTRAGRSARSAQFGALSFHETKNLISGEGGALLINDPRLPSAPRSFARRARTAASSFAARWTSTRGSMSGSSYLPGEIIAAFLWAQMEEAGTSPRVECRIGSVITRPLNRLETDCPCGTPS